MMDDSNKEELNQDARTRLKSAVARPWCNEVIGRSSGFVMLLADAL
jgi:hypothetical protein